VLRILLGCLLLSGAMSMSAAAENAPGVTDSEIKVGQTMPYTGPAAQLSAPGLAEIAYIKMINDQGGINGRKINLISVDDGYLPWRTANETRKLIEVERVAFIFGSIGTPTQLAVASYLNERKIPQLFIDSGAYRWGNYSVTPYTMGGVRPSYRVGARFYTRKGQLRYVAMIDCIVAETSRQDTKLNENYKSLTSKISPKRKQSLLHAQRAWITFRDANCKFYGDPEGGTSARLSANECVLNATADRAKELKLLIPK
jgi:uncharacterized protein YecT (DUF1311 family)